MAAGAKSISENRPVSVAAVQVQTADIYNSVLAGGTIEDAGEIKITNDDNSQVSKIYIQEGQLIQKGQLLLALNTVEGQVASIPQISNEILNAADYFGISESDIKSAASQFSYVQNTGDEPVYIYSPMDGVVTSIKVSEGDLVSKGTVCLNISDKSNMQIRASISQNNIASMQLGMPVDITGDAFQGTTYKGVLTQIMPVAKQVSSITGSGETVVEAIITIKNPNNNLRAGYTADVKIYTTKIAGTLTIPYEAVIQDEDNSEYVYVIENDRCWKRNITTGNELDTAIEVKSGLTYDEWVILNPDSSLYNGAKVTQS